jgi:site-specific recombinase XerD
VKKAWAGVLQAAQIENFRWHDMRHDFASQLVMRGVDLNTVRELMGHADMSMTMRYAHLAPEVKMRAVEMLV